MMKILINTYPTAYITPGGGEIQLRKTFEMLKKNDIDVELYDPWNPQLDTCDIVHFFSVYGGSYPFCKMVKDRGKKLVVSPVIWLDDMSKYPIGEIKSILDLADLILPNSQMEAEMLEKKLGISRAKMRIIHNAIDSNVFNNIDIKAFAKMYQLDKYILNVANIEPRKNQYSLIRAMGAFDIPLVLIGNVRDQNYLEKCKTLAKEKSVLFVNPLPHNSKMLLSAYAGATAFVLPSTLETPGLAALEAAAAGCENIVLTGIGCTREYFKEYVEYIDNVGDISEIVASIKKKIVVSENPSRKLKEHILNNFTWEHTAEQTMLAYQDALYMCPITPPEIKLGEGIELGKGWYEVEYDGERYFRWMSIDAEIIVKNKKSIYIDCCRQGNVLIEGFEKQRKIFALVFNEYYSGKIETYFDFAEETKIHFKCNKLLNIDNDTRKLGIRVYQIY